MITSIKLWSFLISISIIFAYGSAYAEEDWRLFGVTKYLILYYDLGSVNYPSEETVKLWIKYVSKCNDRRDWPIKNHPNCSDVEWVYVLTLLEINCSKKQERDMKSIGYSKEGTSLESLPEEPSPWSHITPESYMEGLYKILCP